MCRKSHNRAYIYTFGLLEFLFLFFFPLLLNHRFCMSIFDLGASAIFFSFSSTYTRAYNLSVGIHTWDGGLSSAPQARKEIDGVGKRNRSPHLLLVNDVHDSHFVSTTMFFLPTFPFFSVQICKAFFERILPFCSPKPISIVLLVFVLACAASLFKTRGYT